MSLILDLFNHPDHESWPWPRSKTLATSKLCCQNTFGCEPSNVFLLDFFFQQKTNCNSADGHLESLYHSRRFILSDQQRAFTLSFIVIPISIDSIQNSEIRKWKSEIRFSPESHQRVLSHNLCYLGSPIIEANLNFSIFCCSTLSQKKPKTETLNWIEGRLSVDIGNVEIIKTIPDTCFYSD